MLVQVSSKLSESHLEDLKYLFEPEGIPLKDLEEATSGIKLFQLLQYRDKLSMDNLELLKASLSTIGREDLRKLVEEYEKEECIHDGPAKKSPSVLTDILLRDIAKDVGKDWKMLARELEVPESNIQAILHGNPFDLHEQSYQSLQLWKEIGNKRATATVLHKALKRQHLNSIAHKYFHNCQGQLQL